jgi:hypothetical protein
MVTIVDVGGLILRVEPGSTEDGDLVRRVIGSLPTDQEPQASLVIGRRPPELPSRPPDFDGPYGRHWDDGTTHWFSHDWGFAARVLPAEATLGGSADGYRRWVAVRNSMLFVLARLMLAQGRFLLHAAAVRRDRRALLIVGDSGAGKSSLAYAAHLAGWHVLGDDMVAIDAQPAGITARGVPRVPTIPADVATAADQGEALPNDPRGRLELVDLVLDRAAAPVAGVLICGHDDGPGVLVPATAMDAVQALVPALVLSALPGPVTRWFPVAARLAREPSFRLLHTASDGQRLERAGQLLDEAMTAIDASRR